MHPHTEELLRHLDAARVGLHVAVDGVPSTLRETRPAADRWSVAEILEHLATVEQSITKLLTARLSEARAAGSLSAATRTDSVLDPVTAQILLDRSKKRVASERSSPRGEMTSAQAVQALEETRAALRHLLVDHDGLDLTPVRAPHPALGEIDGYAWFAFVGSHEARHTAQIREIWPTGD
jgi:uncharacterized damage-inducible protein DinB